MTTLRIVCVLAVIQAIVMVYQMRQFVEFETKCIIKNKYLHDPEAYCGALYEQDER